MALSPEPEDRLTVKALRAILADAPDDAYIVDLDAFGDVIEYDTTIPPRVEIKRVLGRADKEEVVVVLRGPFQDREPDEPYDY